MRTLVDLEREQVQSLDRLAVSQKRSRAALIREAIRDYLDCRAESTAAEAFGLWPAEGEDGLAYQERLRAEW